MEVKFSEKNDLIYKHIDVVAGQIPSQSQGLVKNISISYLLLAKLII